MSTFIVAAIIVGSVGAICLLLVRMHNAHKREAHRLLLQQFNQAEAEHRLHFSKQEVLKNCMLGLDDTQRKMLVAMKADSQCHSILIDLDEVSKCTVKKIYGIVNVGHGKGHKQEQHLEKIALHFNLDDKPSIDIVFYRNLDNHIYEAMELEQKAKQWEAMLSKKPIPSKSIA